MKLKQMMAGLCALMAVGAGMTAAVAAPQNQNRPLLLVVPYPPGGSTDILARIMQPQLSKELGGRPVVVENRPGAASQIATNHVARASRMAIPCW